MDMIFGTSNELSRSGTWKKVSFMGVMLDLSGSGYELWQAVVSTVMNLW
jgi:hypothetical protein